jgi:SMODS and SLOG-associating 2TM effector domain 3/SMODS and SLOG-associating 2TM effector domain 1
MTEDDFPPLYQAADAASQDVQKKFFWALGGNLALLVIVAIMSAANVKTSTFALLQMIPLVGTLALTFYLAIVQPQRIWYGTRALAESVKTISWRYMMRAEPFNQGNAADREHFRQLLTDIFISNKSVSAYAVTMTAGPQITQSMTDVRNLSLRERITLYETQRVHEQHEWYNGKAAANKRSSKRWFGLLIAMNILALGFAVGKVACPTANFWLTDILVSAAGSVMAWLQTKRFQELAASYTLTAHEIGLIRSTLPDPAGERIFSVYVGDAENAFSREHTQWQARRDAG